MSHFFLQAEQKGQGFSSSLHHSGFLCWLLPRHRLLKSHNIAAVECSGVVVCHTPILIPAAIVTSSLLIVQWEKDFHPPIVDDRASSHLQLRLAAPLNRGVALWGHARLPRFRSKGGKGQSTKWNLRRGSHGLILVINRDH